MSAMPRLPNPLTPETIGKLMNERPSWDTSHPQFSLYRQLIQRGFEIMYPGPTRFDAIGKMIDDPPQPPERIARQVAEANREMELGFDERPSGGGEVHVQSHSRDGGKVEVADYWRAAPGEGSGSERAPESPSARNLLEDAENGRDEADGDDTQAGTDDGRPKSVSPVPNPVMRNDPEGSGDFGAPRKGHLHQGIDLEANPGDEVVSPVDGTIKKIAPAYSDPKYEGLLAITIKGDDGQEYKFLYVVPKNGDGNILVKDKDRVSAGEPIGTAQDRAAYEPSGKMKNHIHIEIRDKSGKVLDPTPRVEEWRKRQ